MYYKLLRFIVFVLVPGMIACTPKSLPAPAPTRLPPTATIVPPSVTPSGISSELISELDATLTSLAEKELFTGSVLIGQQGSVVFSQGYGLADRQQNIPNGAQTRYRLGSVTKQFTAVSVLALESQNKLEVKDPICSYLPDCPTTWQDITIHHLLTHTSGIPEFTEMSDYNKTKGTPSSPEQTIARFRDLPLDFQPGAGWSYSNSGYVVLGYIIEQTSGQSYEGFLQQSIFTPLNLQNTGYDHNSNGLAVGYKDRFSDAPADYIDMSIPYAAGGLYSTVEDLFRWEQALSSEQLIPKAYLDEMFSPQAQIPNSGGNSYGYGWVIGTERGRRIAQHPGGIDGFATSVARYPDEQIFIVVLCNQESQDVGFIHELLSKKVFGE